MTLDGGTLGWWQVITPYEQTNSVKNPSAETGTTGWTATSGAVSRVVGGRFGAYALRLLASAQHGRIEYSDLPQLDAGTNVVASAYVKADSTSVVLRLAYGGTTVEQAHPGDSAWHRLEVTTTAVAATTPTIGIRDGRASDWANVDVDGVQFESGVTLATTYIDGDQDGCRWDAGTHASTSTRLARAAGGGTVTSFDSLGLEIKQQVGIGTAPVAVATQPLAFGDGEIFQRQTAKPRVFTLSTLIQAADLEALHGERRTVFDALNPDARSQRAPLLLRYAGAAEPKTIQAVLETGFDGAGLVRQTFDRPALRFVAPDPYWSSEYDAAASLDGNESLTVSYLAYRDPDGVWDDVASGIGVAATVYAVFQHDNGVYYVGGDWTSGVASSDYLAQWNPVTDAWDDVGDAVPDGPVYDITVTRDGYIVIVGNFTDWSDAIARTKVAVYDPSAGDFTGGFGTTPATASVLRAVAIDGANNVWTVGTSTTSTNLYSQYWNGSSWTDAGTNALAYTAYAIALGPDGKMYIGTANGVYRWDTSSWTAIGTTSSNAVHALAWGKDGRLYAGGAFTSIGGVSANRVARWNGSIWEPLGSGIGAGTVYALGVDASGRLYVGGEGFTSAGGVDLSEAVAGWNGASWYQVDIDMPGSSGTRALHVNAAGALMLGWGGDGTATTPPVTTVTNDGSALAYPVVQFTATGSVQSLVNLTTGQEIRFELTLSAGERATLDLRPGQKTFRTPYRDITSAILPGSDLDTWALAPGVNRIALYGGAGDTTGTLYWRPRHWGAD